jgi:hypothetical protein
MPKLPDIFHGLEQFQYVTTAMVIVYMDNIIILGYSDFDET